MADYLQQNLGISSVLIPGRRGVFEVAVNGQTVACKTLEGFPDEATCLEAVRAALA